MTDEELDRLEALLDSGSFQGVGDMARAIDVLIAEVRRLRAKTVEVPVLGKVE